MEIILFIAIGIIFGALSTIMGISPGVVLVPILLSFFKAKGVPTALIAPLTVATGLACGWLGTISSMLTHRKKLVFQKPLFLMLLFNAIVAAPLIHFLAPILVGKLFEILFALIVLSLPLVSYLSKPNNSLPRTKTNNVLMTFISGVFNGLGNIFGIGGGPFIVLTFEKYGYTMKEIIAHLMLAGTFTLFIFLLVYVFLGLGKDLPAYSLGFIYLPAMLYIGVPLAISARFATIYRHKMNPRILKIAFNWIVLIIGVGMLIKVFVN